MVKNKGAIANELKPFEPTHPGEVLKDEMDCRGISQRQLAHEIGVSSSLLNEVLNGERALNTQLVAKTEHSHPLGMVVSTHFRCGKGVKRGLKNGALPFKID